MLLSFFLFERNWSWILLAYLSSADLKSNFITPLKNYSTISLVPCMLDRISKLFVTVCLQQVEHRKDQ